MEKEFSSSAESAYVYTNFPADIDWFFHQLSLMHQKYPNNHVSVQHLIHFQMDSKRSSANLKVLSTILPFVLSDNQKYESFYYYSKMEQNDFMQLVFPYFVITSEYVLVISGDLRHSVLHSDAEARNMYQKEFLKVQALSKPLLTSYATQESALTHYLESFVSYDYKYMYALENQPCLHDIAKNKIQGKISLGFNLSPSLLAGLQIFSDKLSQSNFCSFFSKSGLKYFADSRTLRGQLGAFFSPFTTEECIAELSSLLDSDKNYTYLMLDDTFELPSYINLEIYENKAMNIIRIDENLNVCIITITESSICEAFLDFVSSLKESEHICSETEYRATLLSAIEQLQESLDSLNE